MAEQIKEEEVVLHSGKDVMINKAFVACDKGDRLTMDEMLKDENIDEVKKIIDQLYDVGCLQVLLTGGEAMLRPDFIEIYLYLKSLILVIWRYNSKQIVQMMANIWI